MVWRFSEKITAQVVSLVVTFVLAWILDPEEFGIVGYVNIFLAIAEVFVTSGLGTALIQKKEVERIDFSTVFWSNMALSVVIFGAMYLSAPWIAAYYEIPLLLPLTRVLAIKIPISAFNSVQNAYVSREMLFRKFFFATIIGTVVSAFVGIKMALMGYGVWALVAQVLTNTVIDTLVLFLTIDWKPRWEFSFERAKPLVDYGWKILATDLIGTIFNNLNGMIIGKKYTASDLAYYDRGKKIPDIINTNVGATLSAVLFPAMSLSSGLEEIRAIRRRSLKMMGYVMFPMMLGLVAVADTLIGAIMRETWHFAIPYVRIAAISAMIGVMGTTLIQETKAIGRSDMTLKMEFCKKTLYVIVLLIAMRYGVRGIAYTLIINEVIAFCFNVYPVKKFIGFDFKMHFLDAFSSLWMAGVMCGVVYFVGRVVQNHLLALIIQVILGIIIYVGLSILTKNDSFLYLKDLIFAKLGGLKCRQRKS